MQALRVGEIRLVDFLAEALNVEGCMGPTIDLEDDTTWPEPFREKALTSKQLVIAYLRERDRIDRLAVTDVLIRINRPPNGYESDYLLLIDQLEAMMATYRIVAYHCTRLTPREVVNIKSNGLRVLTADLVRNKIESCAADGHITQTDAEYLLSSEYIAHTLENKYEKRMGHICYCPNRSTLRSGGDVHRLFRLWGGEAIYGGHEDDDRISGVLRRVGVPYIVKCAVPWSDAEEWCKSFSVRFLSHMLEVGSGGFDLFAERDLEPGNVLDLIGYTDPRFLGLTEFNRWRPSERPEVLP
ncbi:MAG: hypothetical protein ACYDB9_02090 [Gammaproteobacteria bacterium]